MNQKRNENRSGKRPWTRAHLLVRLFFLLLTPTMFLYFGIGFIWHSFFFASLTMVILLWLFFILIGPLFGRIGCGWFCFIGTIQDLTSGVSAIKLKRRKPLAWTRRLNTIAFFASVLILALVRSGGEYWSSWKFDLFRLSPEFNIHYKHVWMYDAVGAMLLGLFLPRRWACRNLCFMGFLCAAGSRQSRWLPVADPGKCNRCGKCETVCPVDIPIRDYIQGKKGLITDSECLHCGNCIDSCPKSAIRMRWIWRRKVFLRDEKNRFPFSMERDTMNSAHAKSETG